MELIYQANIAVALIDVKGHVWMALREYAVYLSIVRTTLPDFFTLSYFTKYNAVAFPGSVASGSV